MIKGERIMACISEYSKLVGVTGTTSDGATVYAVVMLDINGKVKNIEIREGFKYRKVNLLNIYNIFSSRK